MSVSVNTEFRKMLLLLSGKNILNKSTRQMFMARDICLASEYLV